MKREPDNLDEPVVLVEHPQYRNVWIEPEHELTPAQREELEASARDGDRCLVAIHHGPGHQSTTECDITGDHTRHEVVYGEFRQVASWTGNRDVFSGYHDDFDGETNPSYVRDDWTLRRRRRLSDRRDAESPR